jgi:orsellinic acid C2-O-methyltransferase
MTTQAELSAEQAGARRRLMPMLFGMMHAQMLHTLARLRIADLLADGPATAGDLAAHTECQPAALHRLLRAGAALGLFELDGGRFGLTDAGRLLCAGSAGSIRNLVLLFGGDAVWRSWGQLEYSVRTGETAFEHLVGTPPFVYLAAHPAEEAIFNAAMAEHTREVAPDIAARCPLPAGSPTWAEVTARCWPSRCSPIPRHGACCWTPRPGCATRSGCSPTPAFGAAARS